MKKNITAIKMENVASLLLAVYIATLYTGTVFSYIQGLNLNLIFGVFMVFFVSVQFLSKSRPSVPKVDTFLFFLYVLCILPSVMMSQDIEQSTGNFLAFGAYWATLIFPLYFFRERINLIMHSSVIVGLASALYVLYKSFMELETISRLQVIGDIDTNHLAFGLGVLVILTIRMVSYFRSRAVRSALFLAIMFMIFSVLLLMSRTAILGLSLGFILALLVNVIVKYRFDRKDFTKTLPIAFAVFFVPLFFLYYIFQDSFIYLGSRFSEARFYDVRLAWWSESLLKINSWKDVLFGFGYFQTNPHNEYIRYFSNSGLFGAMWLSAFLVLVYLFKVWPTRSNMSTFMFQNWLFFYMIIYLGTYGHVKTFWVAPAAIIMIFLSSSRKRSSQKIEIVGVNRK